MPGPAPKAQGKIQALAAFGRLRLLRAEHKLGPAAGYGRKRRQCLNFTLSLKFFAENKIEGGGAQPGIAGPSGLVPDWKASFPIGNQAAQFWRPLRAPKLSAAPFYFIFCEKFANAWQKPLASAYN